MSANPIGIFDSGIGGLTVCKAVNDKMPNENLIYFGDTARFPYGTRSDDTIIRYSREIKEYLISRKVKMIVVACNTASAAALDTIKNEVDIPVIGVIDSGARAACRRLSGDSIGVIGTRATVKSESYIKAIKKIKPELKVFQQQATLFVSLTEEGLIDSDIARLTVELYIRDLFNNNVRTLILGCTHFPLLKKTINEIYPEIDIVDTGIEIASEVENTLKEKNLEINETESNKGKIELYASDITDTLIRLKDIFFGKKETSIKLLNLTGN